MESNELKHWGVLGMHWGITKDEGPAGISKGTSSMAKKDATRISDAKMFYGQTAGTRRKLLNAEIEKKKKTIDGYETALNYHMKNVDSSKSAKKAISERNRIDTVHRGRTFAKKMLGITGSLTTGVAVMAYYANKPAVDNFVKQKVNDLIKYYK